MKEIILKTKAAKLVKKGSPLLNREDLARPLDAEEGECVRVCDEKKIFLAMAYVGFQHKGIGWVYSKKDGETLTPQFIRGIFQKAAQKRSSLMMDDSTTSFRLFNGEGDGLGGITIDWYDGFVVVSWYSAGIYQWKELIIEQLQEAIPNIQGIYEKIRYASKEKLPESQFVKGVKASEPLIVQEEGVRYATYLDEGLMTGIFLDQREVRTLLRDDYSAGKTILNLFSYTGAFSVAAAMGGAVQTTSVDVANRSLEKTREQFEVNGIDASEQKIYVMDVFDYIKYAAKKDLTFDTIVLDPPSFARTKKRTFSVAKDYAGLVEQLVPLTAKKGTLILSTNAANVSEKQFLEMIHKGLRSSGRRYRIAHQKKLPMDFPVAPHTPLSDYLKVVFVEMDFS